MQLIGKHAPDPAFLKVLLASKLKLAGKEMQNLFKIFTL